MFSQSSLLLRQRSPWRELLHPLPLRARRYLWWKRDRCDHNEAILRQPYYKLKPVDVCTTSTTDAGAVGSSSIASKRDMMKVSGRTSGPLPLDQDIVPRDVRLLKPAYPESYYTIPVTRKTGQR